jgi:putative sigma-54 modulation protein
MQLSVTFRHMEATEAIKEYAREKVERIKKYFPDPISAHVVFSVERGYQHVVDVNIHLHNGIVVKGNEVTEDMYSSIDLVMAKIERQVRRYKEQIRGHRARADLSSIPVAYHVLSGEDHDEQAPTATESAEARTIVKTEHMQAKSLTVDEAIMHMNLAGHQFLVFRHTETGHVNVVYKRDDGQYGLIETSPVSAPATATAGHH